MGNVTQAARSVNVSTVALYAQRKRDKKFKKEWEEALDEGIDRLEDEAKRRAFKGVNEPVYYQGERCGYVKKYSDTLAIFLLKGYRPEKFRDNHHITGDLLNPLAESLNKALSKK